MPRSRFAPILLLPVLVGLPASGQAHRNTFPLPIPTKLRLPHDPRPSPYRRATPSSPEGLRTRVVEDAVRAAGGWMRWRSVDSLFLRLGRRELDPLGNVRDNREEHVVLGKESFTRYWEQERRAYTAQLQGAHFRLVEPELPRGDPRAVDIQQELQTELFWLAHPWILFRPGIRTRYLGTTFSRGIEVHALRVEFAPGASPYRKVEYLFDQQRGDLLRAQAWPSLEGLPEETYHFTGRIVSRSGLRMPRRREKLIEGVIREVTVVRNLEAKQIWLPASPFSEEGRHRRIRSLARRPRSRGRD